MQNFNYRELCTLSWLAYCDGNLPLTKKIDLMIQDLWHSGTEMPPLNVPIVVRYFSGSGSFTELILVRKELLSAYSGKDENGYTSVKFVDPKSLDTLEIKPENFTWRRND